MRRKILSFTILISIILCFQCTRSKHKSPNHEWTEYLGGPERNHYSSLDQINLTNVSKLQKVWEYHTQDSGQLQCNPIIVDGILYGVTASVEPFALDAATGREIWRARDTLSTTWYGTLRGVVYWEDSDDKRILYTKESDLIALDAKTGKRISSFGNDGKVSLKTGLGESAKNKFVISSTPGTVYKDIIIMPLRISEGADATLGYIQAFNICTGKLAWIFKTIPDPEEEGYETWPPEAYKNANVGGANNWAGMAIDRGRGIVYVPTGSAAPDFYGKDRIGSNLFANCLLALDASTGKLIWHFQFVHHDILDRDAPAPPNLLTVTHNGKKTDAVAQVTKHGFVFLFDRENGKPLFQIEEVPVPSSDIPGEQTWPTQPRPAKPAPFSRTEFTENDIHQNAENREELIQKFRTSRYEGPFTPLSLKGSIIFPGLDGGAEWGGAAVDPAGVMYVNSSEMPWLISLRETSSQQLIANSGREIYAAKCASCHGADRKGNQSSGFPELLNIKNRMNRNQALSIITSGKGMMPGFKTLTDEEQKYLVAFLYDNKNDSSNSDKKEPGVGVAENNTSTYTISGYTKFLDKNGYPAIKPPWGTLNAIDLNTGEYKWKKVFGEYPELTAKGIEQTGAESYGGPVVTAGGLLFIAGTKDKKFKAYNKENGELLWQTELPAAGFATPSTYEVNGKQYIVIACGGSKLGAMKGESYVAFALEE